MKFLKNNKGVILFYAIILISSLVIINDVEKDELTFGALVLNTAAHSAFYGGDELALTKKEYDLLECLLRNKNVAMSREQLLSQVWGYEYMGDTNVVDVYVIYLRQKIDYKYGIHMVETIRGIGYMIKED